MTLLAVLTVTVGLGVAAWVVGAGLCRRCSPPWSCSGLARRPCTSLGPADLVTLGRALLACAVAALTVELLLGHAGDAAPCSRSTVPALALDAVDGRVARRTGTVTAFGGPVRRRGRRLPHPRAQRRRRPDGRVVGAGRRAWCATPSPSPGGALPWLRAPLEFRYWRKVVTATVGIALTVVRRRRAARRR